MHHHNHVKNIKAAVFLNIGFSIIEFVAGFLTNSLTVLADAFHDLGDSLILSFSFFSEKFANKKIENKSFTYGLSRLPLLSALTSSLVMFTGSILILWAAFERIQQPVTPHTNGMLFIAILGIVVNAAAMMRLHTNEGLNTKVLSLHFFEDILGWVAVLVISIIMKFVDLPILDPLTSIAITVYILIRTFMNLKQAILLFIQKAPSGINVDALRKDIMKTKGVTGICDMHVWTLDSIKHIFTAHICIQDSINLQNAVRIRSQIRSILKGYGDFHSTIEVEHESEKCMDQC